MYNLNYEHLQTESKHDHPHFAMQIGCIDEYIIPFNLRAFLSELTAFRCDKHMLYIVGGAREERQTYI